MVRKSLAVFVMALSSVMNSRADADPEVVVRILDADSLSGPVMFQARAVAETILASAGIRVRWDRNHNAPDPVRGGCAAEGSPTTIAMRFAPTAPSGTSASALAAALPFATGGIGITIFLDRLRPALKMSPRPAVLLGHVMAHEIGHKLLGTDTHSLNGLMKARWSGMEIVGMMFEPMKFTPDQAADMRTNLTGRCRLAFAELRVN